jgi:GTP cyclohydrolase N terminal
LKQGTDIRPTIAVTKAHMRLLEIEKSVKEGRLNVDGKIVLNDMGELAVTKGAQSYGVVLTVVAVEPVWYLPGVAARFGIDEGVLRRGLFEDTGGSYPELITRGDLKLFLPPIGGLTVYIFGNVANISDPTKKLALRVHDVPPNYFPFLPSCYTVDGRNVTGLMCFHRIFAPVVLI